MQFIIKLLCLVILVQCSSAIIKSNGLGTFRQTEKSCIKKFNLDEFSVDYFLNQKCMPENNDQFSSFMECVWKKDGLIDGKNNLDFDELKKYITDTFAEAIGKKKVAEAFAKDCINTCKGVKGSTSGETGIKFMNCVTRLFQS